MTPQTSTSWQKQHMWRASPYLTRCLHVWPAVLSLPCLSNPDTKLGPAPLLHCAQQPSLQANGTHQHLALIICSCDAGRLCCHLLHFCRAVMMPLR